MKEVKVELQSEALIELEEVSGFLAELTPEELEPRLELTVLIDPMAALLDTNNNNNNNNNKNQY